MKLVKASVFVDPNNSDVLLENDLVWTIGIGGDTYVYVQYNNLYLVRVTCKNSNAALIVMCLYK